MHIVKRASYTVKVTGQISFPLKFHRHLMDQDKKEHKFKERFPEILRCVLYLVVLSCIAIVFSEQHKMKQRLTAIDDKMNRFERTLRYDIDKDVRNQPKDLLVREKRALALSLESLEKRLKVLEFR